MSRRRGVAMMCLGLGAVAAWAGRPLKVNDTEPVELGTWQMEASVGYRNDAEIHHWEVREELVLDAAVGSKISGEAPDFTATAGLTWTFGSQKENARK